jgi:hypothetical protein
MSKHIIHCKHETLVEIHKLVGHPLNANKHPQRQIELLAKIIDFQGWRHPVVVSKLTGFVVAGHGRIEAAKLLGLEKVPVDYQDFDNEAQEYAFLIADNKIAELAEHDDAKMFEDIKTLGIEDLELLGLDGFQVEMGEMPDLSGGKPEIEQITFTLHHTQAEVVKEALKKAQDFGIDMSLNENKNGSAIYAICADYLQK